MKNKTKKFLLKLYKIIAMTLLIFSIIHSLKPPIIYAASMDIDITSSLDTLIGALSIAFAGVPVIILNVVKLIIIVVGLLIQAVVSGAFSALDGKADWCSLESIIFSGASNKSSNFLDINFLDISAVGNTGAFRTSIAKWYYIIRLICVAILLVILIYVGIRMAISSIAEEQAKYKKMITDWATSMALLFVLHYIIAIIIGINKTLVSAMRGVSDATVTSDLLGAIGLSMLYPGVSGLLAACVYAYLVGQIFSFFALYVKRMITVGFLIMISPLICVTYSIDKISDGKAQALNSWLKELVYNILIQPFHCIIYVAFFDTVAAIIKSQAGYGLGIYIFAIMLLKFMKQAEDILRKIFHFEAQSSSTLAETGKNVMTATGKFAKMGAAAGVMGMNFKQAGGFAALSAATSDRKSGKQAKKELKANFKKENPDGSWRKYKKTDEYKREYNNLKSTKADEMKYNAEKKRESKARKRYDKKHGTGEFDKQVQKQYDEQLDAKMEAAYDAEHGEGEYKKAKAKTKERDASGNWTPDAIKAASEINKTKNKVIRSDDAPDRRTITSDLTKKVNSSSKYGNVGKRTINAISNAKYNLSNPRTPIGKVQQAAMKDAVKWGAGLAGLMIGAGKGSNLLDGLDEAQFMWGFADSLFKNSKNTLTKEGVDAYEKYMKMNPNATHEDAMKFVRSAESKGKSGQLDSKSINELMTKLKEAISNSFDDSRDGQIAANNAIRQLQTNIVTEGANPNIQGIIDQVAKATNMDSQEKADILGKAEDYAETLLEKKMYDAISAAEETGFTADDFGKKVQENVIHKTYNVTNKFEDSTTNNTIVNNIQNTNTTVNNNTTNNNTTNNTTNNINNNTANNNSTT